MQPKEKEKEKKDKKKKNISRRNFSRLILPRPKLNTDSTSLTDMTPLQENLKKSEPRAKFQ